MNPKMIYCDISIAEVVKGSQYQALIGVGNRTPMISKVFQAKSVPDALSILAGNIDFLFTQTDDSSDVDSLN